MLGIFVINDRIPVRQVIDELLLLIDCSEQNEWKGIVLYLPLKLSSDRGITILWCGQNRGHL